jgi:hypothetical protein
MFRFAKCRSYPVIMAGGNDDRMGTAVGVVYCIEEISLNQDSLHGKEFLSWISRFPSRWHIGWSFAIGLPGATVHASHPF